MTIGERVREARKDAGLTMKAFAARIGVSDASISMIENGKNGISDQTVTSICREFNVSEAWLRDGLGEMHAARSREAELAELVRRLLSDRPDSFRSALITTLLRFDPDGPEWAVLEKIYEGVEKEKAQD